MARPAARQAFSTSIPFGARDHHIQNDRVVTGLHPLAQGLGPVGRRVDGVAAGCQCPLEKVEHPLVVLDHENRGISRPRLDVRGWCVGCGRVVADGYHAAIILCAR